MHLAEILRLRPVPGAGLIMMVTQRCPLRCAHCSTSSARRGPDADAAMLIRFAGTFRRGEGCPRVVLLTGGEPLLRPAVVQRVAEACHQAGVGVMVLSGMYFARGSGGGGPRPPVMAALEAADHVSASIDVFHEREVPRRDVFAVLHRLRDRGTQVSVHITGSGPGDGYLAEVTAAVRAEFGGEVPMLVGALRPAGRAAAWLREAPGAGPAPDAGRSLPCAMAAWPVIGVDGRITACCNTDVVDGRVRAPHLELGHAATAGWPQVRDRLDSPALRAIRTVGPVLTSSEGGYCTACHRLDGGAVPRYSAALAGQVIGLAERAGATGFARRYGCAGYAGLVTLGAGPCAR